MSGMSTKNFDIQRNIEQEGIVSELEKLETDEAIKEAFKKLTLQNFEDIVGFIQDTYSKIVAYNECVRQEDEWRSERLPAGDE